MQCNVYIASEIPEFEKVVMNTFLYEPTIIRERSFFKVHDYGALSLKSLLQESYFSAHGQP